MFVWLLRKKVIFSMSVIGRQSGLKIVKQEYIICRWYTCCLSRWKRRKNKIKTLDDTYDLDFISKSEKQRKYTKKTYMYVYCICINFINAKSSCCDKENRMKTSTKT